jgi:hypothetical protein
MSWLGRLGTKMRAFVVVVAVLAVVGALAFCAIRDTRWLGAKRGVLVVPIGERERDSHPTLSRGRPFLAMKGLVS